MYCDIVLHGKSTVMDIRNAPSGSICEIIEADDYNRIGMLCLIPFCTNQGVMVLNVAMASTDKYLGIRRVRPLEKGESFTVTIR